MHACMAVYGSGSLRMCLFLGEKSKIRARGYRNVKL